MFEEFLDKHNARTEFESCMNNRGGGTYEEYYTLDAMYKYCHESISKWDKAILHAFVWRDYQKISWSDMHHKWQKKIKNLQNPFLFEKVEITDNMFEI